jgi:hypothetical protein
VGSLIEDLAACKEGRTELARWNGFSLLFIQVALVGAFVAALLQEYLTNHATARKCRRAAAREARTRFAAWRENRKARRAETPSQLRAVSDGVLRDSAVFEQPNPLTPEGTIVGITPSMLTPGSAQTVVGLTIVEEAEEASSSTESSSSADSSSSSSGDASSESSASSDDTVVDGASGATRGGTTSGVIASRVRVKARLLSTSR